MCKYHAVQKKYYDDVFAEAMYRQVSLKVTSVNASRRSPLINRGYYARVFGNRLALDRFISATAGPRQIVFLGVGFDTSPLTSFQLATDSRVFEVDFPDIMSKKHEMYQSEEEFTSFFAAQGASSSSTMAPPPPPGVRQLGHFSLIGVDMRDTNKLLSLLQAAGLDSDRPTLIISECVLVYMDKASVQSLSSRLGALLQGSAMWVTYDMISPGDRYGQMMIRNLTAAGFSIPGIHDFPTLEAESNRFLQAGWTAAYSITMKQFYNRCISDEEKARLKGLEMVDEVEEWNMLMDHYNLTVAVKNSAELEHAAQSILSPVAVSAQHVMSPSSS